MSQPQTTIEVSAPFSQGDPVVEIQAPYLGVGEVRSVTYSKTRACWFVEVARNNWIFGGPAFEWQKA